jgi:predicted dinucleotide-binding enzyme
MNISVIGSGVVGETLADGFLKHGFPVLRASRSPNKLGDWKSNAGPNARTGTFADAAEFGECVVLAVMGAAAESAVELCGVERLAGKIVIDATNPIDEAPPQDGVLRYFTAMNRSLMERLQQLAPDARFVKAFSCVGSSHMIDPDFGGERPTMFICGDDPAAKKTVVDILETFGWDSEDMGTSSAARAIEPLAMLWCIPGFRENRWNHAFRLLKK